MPLLRPGSQSVLKELPSRLRILLPKPLDVGMTIDDQLQVLSVPALADSVNIEAQQWQRQQLDQRGQVIGLP
jgi:hypothetical protein